MKPGFLSRLGARSARRSKAARIALPLLQARQLHREGHLAEAIAAFRLVLEIDAEHQEAHEAIAGLTLQSGDLEGAVLLYSGLLERNAGDGEAHYKRANALNGLGRWEQAVADYDRAIELSPEFANAYCNRGAALERLSRWAEALDSYDRALALNESDFLAYFNRGSALRALRRPEEAVSSYQRAIAVKPDYVEAHINCGHVLQELRRHASAVVHYDAAIALDPTFSRAFSGRGQSLYNLKLFAEAVTSFDRALALNSRERYLLGLRRQAQMQICEWTDLAMDLQRIGEGLRHRLPVCMPHPVVALIDDHSLQRAAAEVWVREECPPSDVLGPIARRPRPCRIRLGYYSADFRNHPVAALSAELFENHDRSKFEVVAFAFGPQGDDMTHSRLRPAFDQFIDVRDLSDVEVAVLSRELEIDIAVDLGGFTEFSRTSIFAARAAPSQVSFLGYPGTMSASYMDYLIADRIVIPPEMAGYYSENILYLPDSFMPHDSTRAIAATRYTREWLGLPADAFVYCCFNKSYKILPETFDSWMRILSTVSNSVLWLSDHGAEAAANLHREAEKRGVDPRRVIFANHVPSSAEHLARLRAADLFLDTLPYNAHATALDALWAGLPVLTLAGSTFAARVGASLLSAIALHEMIATTVLEYENLAIRFASVSAALTTVREKLARNRSSTALFDGERFVRNLETAYASVHGRHGAPFLPTSVGAAS